MKKLFAYTIPLLLVFSGCMMGPNFQRPAVDLPGSYRFDNLNSDSTVNLSWWELFNDDQLNALVKEALRNNKDIKMAASRVAESRAYLGMAKADLYPKFNIGADAAATNQNLVTGDNSEITGTYSIGPAMAWEIDFWGKYRRAKEAALADLLSTEYAYRTVQIALISDVVASYFSLLDFDKRLEIANSTLESRRESSRIIKERFDEGIVGELDLNQAQLQETIAKATIPGFERWVAYTEHALSIIVGSNPRSIIRNTSLEDQVVPPEIPVGLPADLLLRRPDVLESEQMLAAQTARIGVAQASRFPAISLTGMFGLASNDLSNLVSGDAIIWSAGGSLLGPIFHFGQNKRRVEVERYRTEAALFAYEKTVLVALSEVENALIDIKTYTEEHSTREQQKTIAQNAAYLSNERYNGGVTSYLEVLDSERSLFQAELDESQSLRNKMNAYVNLYKALGGGWISEEEKSAIENNQAD